MDRIDQNWLRNMEDKCTQEMAPPCTAGCPVHVDVRQMTAEISRGNLAEAAKIIRNSVPFPDIVSRICDQTCQENCHRSNLGGAIQVAALERVCLPYFSAEKVKIFDIPSNGKKIAIIGGGMSGLSAAIHLSKKGYGVVVFKARKRIGGKIWNMEGEHLPYSVINSDLTFPPGLDIEIRLETMVRKDIHLQELIDTFSTQVPVHLTHSRLSFLVLSIACSSFFRGACYLSKFDEFSLFFGLRANR